MDAIFYSTQVDVYCEDCDKTYEDLWAQTGGGVLVWTCPDCGHEHQGGTERE